MIDELTYRITALALLGALKAIRWRTRQRADLTDTRAALQKNVVDTVLLVPVAVLFNLSIIVYALFPDMISWARLPFAGWLRGVGVILGSGALCLLAWADHHLGKNFSMTLRIRKQHVLVTHGPYRWIRHPIYTAGSLFGVSVFLVSANYLVGLCWIGGCSLLYACRIPQEEAMMLDEFGDDYRQYMGRTGRLLPRLFQ